MFMGAVVVRDPPIVFMGAVVVRDPPIVFMGPVVLWYLQQEGDDVVHRQKQGMWCCYVLGCA